jgi:hypothetical protein
LSRKLPDGTHTVVTLKRNLSAMLLFAITLNIAAAYVAMRRTGTIVNPFSVAMMLFAMCGLLYLWDPLVDPTSGTGEVSPTATLYILLFSIGFLCANFFLRRSHFTATGQIGVRFGNKHLLFAACLLFMLFSTYLVLKKNDNRIPLFVIGDAFASGKGMRSEETDVPFFTPVALALSRTMAMILAIDLMLSRSTLVAHFNKNRLLYLMAGLGVLLALLPGKRNVLLWPIAFFSFGMAMVSKPRLRFLVKAAAVVFAFLIAFTVIGNIRRGFTKDSALKMASISEYLRDPIPIPVVGDIVGWMARYAGVVYPNLSALIANPPPPSYGRTLLADHVPGVITDRFFETPMNTPRYMLENDLYPYFGSVFRTAFADVYADFGYYGSLVWILFLYSLAVLAHNRSTQHVRWVVIYMALIPGLLMLPYLNRLTGIHVVIPIAICALMLKWNVVMRVVQPKRPTDKPDKIPAQPRLGYSHGNG